MSAPSMVPGAATGERRRFWVAGTLGVTAVGFAAAIVLAPAAGATPSFALTALLFVGSSAHVASSGWFASLPQVRRYGLSRPARYLIAPAALVVLTAVGAAATSPGRFAWLLLGYFAWQFFHFQRQNLGLAAVAASSTDCAALTRPERLALTAAGLAGIVGLVSHPELLQLGVRPPGRFLFGGAAVAIVAVIVVGIGLLARRPRPDRPASFVVLYLVGLAFFVPVFAFTSPYAAVAGLTIAHGLQYLLLVGLVADGEARPDRRAISLLVFVNVAVVGGLALQFGSHLHDAAPLGRALFGAYLGCVMAHFVFDAGIWRLRDPFPRAMLAARTPYLMRPAGAKPPS